jgi:DNA-binding HxlR family transcriptional regulator
MWTMLALRNGPRPVVRLFDEVRSLDGPIGHGTLFATVARLERLALVEQAPYDGDRGAYRLTQLGAAAVTSLAAVTKEAQP